MDDGDGDVLQEGGEYFGLQDLQSEKQWRDPDENPDFSICESLWSEYRISSKI